MITDRSGRHKVLLPINHNYCNSFKTNAFPCLEKSFQNQILTESLSKVTNSSVLENPHLCKVSGCCYGYCDKLCDWWIKLCVHNIIG